MFCPNSGTYKDTFSTCKSKNINRNYYLIKPRTLSDNRRLLYLCSVNNYKHKNDEERISPD